MYMIVSPFLFPVTANELHEQAKIHVWRKRALRAWEWERSHSLFTSLTPPLFSYLFFLHFQLILLFISRVRPFLTWVNIIYMYMYTFLYVHSLQRIIRGTEIYPLVKIFSEHFLLLPLITPTLIYNFCALI